MEADSLLTSELLSRMDPDGFMEVVEKWQKRDRFEAIEIFHTLAVEIYQCADALIAEHLEEFRDEELEKVRQFLVYSGPNTIQLTIFNDRIRLTVERSPRVPGMKVVAVIRCLVH